VVLVLRQTEIHRKEVAELFRNVEQLEDENLKMLSELFECQVEDLHISRSVMRFDATYCD